VRRAPRDEAAHQVSRHFGLYFALRDHPPVDYQTYMPRYGCALVIRSPARMGAYASLPGRGLPLCAPTSGRNSASTTGNADFVHQRQ
jgi:hypothetical protein